MIRKWLLADFDQAEEWLTDTFLSGDSYMKWDIAKILDGEVVDDLIRACARRDQDEVSRILKSHVDRFIQSEEGQRLVDLKASEIRQDRYEIAMEWTRIRKEEMA